MMSKNNNSVKVLFIYFCLAFILLPSLDGQNKNPAGKLFIIGGGRKPASMIKKMIEVAKLQSGGYGVILPMSSSEPLAAIEDVRDQFAESGFEKIYGVM